MSINTSLKSSSGEGKDHEDDIGGGVSKGSRGGDNAKGVVGKDSESESTTGDNTGWEAGSMTISCEVGSFTVVEIGPSKIGSAKEADGIVVFTAAVAFTGTEAGGGSLPLTFKDSGAQVAKGRTGGEGSVVGEREVVPK